MCILKLALNILKRQMFTLLLLFHVSEDMHCLTSKKMIEILKSALSIIILKKVFIPFVWGISNVFMCFLKLASNMMCQKV